MVRMSWVAVLFVALAACGSGSDEAASEAGKAESRCVSAEKAAKASITYAEKLKEQSPGFDPQRFYTKLEQGKVDTTGFGVVETEQMSHQIISDNPECFSVVKVAEARRFLKRVDPLLLEAVRLQFAETP